MYIEKNETNDFFYGDHGQTWARTLLDVGYEQWLAARDESAQRTAALIDANT